MRAPRIAYLAQHFLPESGALPARVSEMARVWVAQGAEVTVLTAMPHRPEGRIRDGYRGRLFSDDIEDGIRVLRCWVYASPSLSPAATFMNNISFAKLSAIQGMTADVHPDVLIASEPPFFPHATGMWLARWWGIPVVLEIRDLWPDYVAEMGLLPRTAERLLFAAERFMLRRADHVVTVTESFRSRVIAKGVAPERASVISNGIDPDFYRPVAAPKLHPALVRRDGERVVGYLGNFGRGQALDQVIEAARLIRLRRRNVRFVLVGDGPTSPGISSRATELGGDFVSIWPPIPKKETVDFYNACDVVLVPHAPLKLFAETVPSKLFEVMACGRPLVASVAGEAAEIVRSSGGGLVVEPGDPVSLAEAIGETLDDKSGRLAASGAAMRAFVMREYSRAALANRYFEILRSIVR